MPSGRMIIVVPGGGSQRSEECTSLPPWVTRRLDKAAQLYHAEVDRLAKTEEGKISSDELQALHPIIVVLSAGTTHRPNYVNGNGWPIVESTSEAYYLMQLGGGGGDQEEESKNGKQGAGEGGNNKKIEAKYIYRETTSLDTIGNFYFFRTYHLEPHRQLLIPQNNNLQKVGASSQPQQQRTSLWNPKIKVVTSQFHMPRTRAICDWLLALPANPMEVQLTMLLKEQQLQKETEGVQQTEGIATQKEVVSSKSSASPSSSIVASPQNWEVEYFEVSDEGIDAEMIAERSAREQASLVNFNKMVHQPGGRFFDGPSSSSSTTTTPTTTKITTTLADVQEWLFTDHKAYCTHDEMTPDQDFGELTRAAMDEQKKRKQQQDGVEGGTPKEVSGALLSSY